MLVGVPPLSPEQLFMPATRTGHNRPVLRLVQEDQTPQYSRAGMMRRMRALCWMGHGPAEVADLVGETPKETERWLKGWKVRPYVYRVVDQAFEELCARFGPNEAAADQARAKGWPSPMAWLGVDMDRMNAQAHVDVPRGISKKAYPLESQVYQALLGVVGAADLLRAEKVSVVSILHNAGWSDRRIAAWLRWNPDGDLAKGMRGVCKYREREGITGGGLPVDSWDGSRADEEFIIVPPTGAWDSWLDYLIEVPVAA